MDGELFIQRPARGVTVLRFEGDRPLMRAVPEHYGTTLHLSGRSRWTSGARHWSSEPGSLSIKVPGEAVVEHAREGKLAFQAVFFDAELVDEACSALERPTAGPGVSAVDANDPRAEVLRALHRHVLADALDDSVVCDALHALSDLPAPHHGFAAAVTRARAFLDERLTETVELEDLAAHARLDKFRLCRAFREQVGLPPHAYVTHRRVALAQRLLTRGLGQAEVAARVGFYDQSLLHRHFKRIVQLTPGAFVRGLG